MMISHHIVYIYAGRKLKSGLYDILVEDISICIYSYMELRGVVFYRKNKQGIVGLPQLSSTAYGYFIFINNKDAILSLLSLHP